MLKNVCNNWLSKATDEKHLTDVIFKELTFIFMCCMDIKPPRFNHHSSHINSKQNKRTPQTDIERILHHPARIKV